MLQKFVGPLVGTPFCGGPCSAESNMLNIPKSAYDCASDRLTSLLWIRAVYKGAGYGINPPREIVPAAAPQSTART